VVNLSLGAAESSQERFYDGWRARRLSSPPPATDARFSGGYPSVMAVGPSTGATSRRLFEHGLGLRSRRRGGGSLGGAARPGQERDQATLFEGDGIDSRATPRPRRALINCGNGSFRRSSGHRCAARTLISAASSSSRSGAERDERRRRRRGDLQPRARPFAGPADRDR
jgi:hypothetical protein